MTKKVTFDERKSMTVRESGRSSDFIPPSFGFGCLLNCAYCYVHRHKPELAVSIANNDDKILARIDRHVRKQGIKQANQTDEKYWTYDIACNDDFALHSKYHNWEKIFNFFKNHPLAKATLATKIIPVKFLQFDPERKVRIRFSIMPQNISSIVEPYTAKTLDKIKAIEKFYDAGYDVDINFSPVILQDTWEEDYAHLFQLVDQYVPDRIKEHINCEVIMLTHNEKKHERNEIELPEAEKLLWQPDMQQVKYSSYGGRNMRYKNNWKRYGVDTFRQIHDDIIPLNTIRYIF